MSSQKMSKNGTKQATLYRMVSKEHRCPYGIKSLYLLKRKGYTVDDRHLRSKKETETFKKEYQVDTTPQTFIDRKRIGGYDALRSFFNMPPAQPQGTSYKPVAAVFFTTFFMALVLLTQNFNIHTPDAMLLLLIQYFIALSMCVLAILKLQNLFAFSNQFITYDIVARRFVPYAYMYPFIEAAAGIIMLAPPSPLLFAATPAALFIGTIGALSVFKAVYIDKRTLKCACVGGNSNVPLGFLSLTENIMMILISLWMLSTIL